jgi:ketosteroid isomerase-like protein
VRSQQELSDRLDIQDLITAYSYAIDFHQFDDLDAIFTPDATLDFTATGGVAGPLPDIKTWLASVLVSFAGHQHLVATSEVRLDGDAATARTLCHNPMYLPEKDGAQQILFVGLWYLDTFARTADGWRITNRVQQKGYLHGLGGR